MKLTEEFCKDILANAALRAATRDQGIWSQFGL